MPKINAAGEPSWADARGTDETATNAADRTYFLDPTASVNDEGVLADNEGLKIEGDEAERFETREEREQREQREREEGARAKRDETLDDAEAHANESGDYDETKPNPGTVAKNIANEKSATDKPAGADKGAVQSVDNGVSTGKDDAKSPDNSGNGEVASSAGTSSKGSSKASAKTTANS